MNDPYSRILLGPNRRTLLGGCAAAILSAAHSRHALAEAVSTLSGAGKTSIERYLQQQQQGLQDGATAQGVMAARRAPRNPHGTADRLLMWNEISLDANARDYVKPADPSLGYHIQFGPHRASRAIAMVQLAVFEAVNAKLQSWHSSIGFPSASGDASLDAAIACASHDMLVALYPPQSAIIDAIYASDLAQMAGSPPAIAAGLALGAQASAAVQAARANDGSDLPEPSIPGDYQPSHAPGTWDVDPVSRIMVALGAKWGLVTPFTLDRAAQFRAPPPPSLDDGDFREAFFHTKMLGGDPRQGTATRRTGQQTFVAKFWSYDGTPGLCAPPRLYNQIARQLAAARGIAGLGELARFLAMVNIALADAGISAWETKWHYKYWRPVTAIRYPGVAGGDPTWYPLGAQATNTVGPNLTPPFPAYPSGHATFGGALFAVLRAYMPEDTAFTFVSDEFNGLNRDVYGNLRPRRPASFSSLTDAETSNAESRIYDGVHWEFDCQAGIAQGRRIGDHVLKHFARPA